VIYGSGKFTYELVPGWAKLPAGWNWDQASGLAVDSEDRVFVFMRTDHPVIILDRDGNFIKSWGDGLFGRPHGLTIGPDGSVYCTDDKDHVVHKFTSDGKLLMTLGTKGKPSDSGYILDPDLMKALGSIKRGAGPFNRPTQVTFAPSGEMYITDGYGNARVHRFTADGKLIGSWGKPGAGPGEFCLPHGAAVDKNGRVFVADRENSRVQIFTAEGKFLEQWTDVIKAADVFIKDDVVYIAELPGRITITDLDGKVLARVGEAAGVGSPVLPNAHSLWIDSHRDLYVGEVSPGPRIEKFVLKG